jgi:hypothetical protein
VDVGSTILANSTNGGGSGDCSGITSSGYNLIEDPCSMTGDTTGNISGVDPMLDVLADNDGPTFTHALLPGSQAIDAGTPACPPPSLDQRGIDRPQGLGCDIGSFETTPPTSAISFPANGAYLRSPVYAAGCGNPTPNVCGTASANPDGASLDFVEVRISTAGTGTEPPGRSPRSGTWSPAQRRRGTTPSIRRKARTP